MLAGLEPLDSGRILIGERDVSAVRPRDRDIAMVFQNYALYPQLNVAANMGFALKQHGVPKEERMRRVRDVAKLLDLEPFLDRKPKNLSGGQRQRVAMGRAIVREPQVFLMDEPLYHEPANLFVAGFIGSPAMNLLPGSWSGPLHIAEAEIARADLAAEGSLLGFRPDALSVGSGPIRGRIRAVEDLGPEVFVHLLVVHEGEERRLVAKVPAPFAGAVDDSVALSVNGNVHIFGDDGTRIATVTALARGATGNVEIAG
jgi:multiple sugar transport system ATP-binding protein